MKKIRLNRRERRRIEVNFWKVVERRGKPDIILDHVLFLRMLEAEGFGNFKIGDKNILIKNEGGIVKECRVYDIKQYIRMLLSDLPHALEGGYKKKRFNKQGIKRRFFDKLF